MASFSVKVAFYAGGKTINMERKEIEKKLQENDSTVLSFPERGPWGNSHFRGNCSGWIHAFLIWKYRIQSMAEIFAGGGTGYDVCLDFGIPYVGIDLNPNPVRKDIVAMNILDDNIALPDGFYTSDMVFLHPPYPSINGIQYANSMWKDTTGCLQEYDIQNMTWEKGMRAVNHAIMRAYTAMQAGSYEAFLVGDVRKNGVFRSMLSEVVIPGQMQQMLVKMQHNTVSGRNGITYGGHKGFVPLAHELIVVVKKPSGYELTFLIPRDYKLDVRNSLNATWKDVIVAVLRKIGRAAHLDEIYKEVEGCQKCHNNPLYWKDKVRQVLQTYDIFQSCERGVWSIASN